MPTEASSTAEPAAWRLDMGARPTTGGVHFAVWAPAARRVEVEIVTPDGVEHHPLAHHENGCHSGEVPGLAAGTRYRYRLDGRGSFPDPCSRSQPEGVHAASQVVDPADFRWHDGGWPGLDPDRLVIYELHVGTMTPEGTFDALSAELPELKRLGVTAIELMPVAECPGQRNWGYDGVDLYAPASYYGGPDGLKRLVDAAHQAGVGVILDVVYNHLGPEGNYLRQFSPDYFTDRYHTPWGEALNFDGPNCAWVRRFMIDNAAYWIAEYHLDGLRLDAVHAIYDESERHLLREIGERCHTRRAGTRRPVAHRPLIILESHDNDVRLIRPIEAGGYGLDAVWADDFHHAVRVYLTGERLGYFADYPGTLDAVARSIEQGFLYQGEPSRFWGRARGTRVTDEPGRAFVFCIQNHDQVGNRAFGDRLNHAIDPDRYAAASALLLLCPETPMLWMGQEFAAAAPFQYFTDHPPELGRLVTEGRREEVGRVIGFTRPEDRARIPDPQAVATFLRSKLTLAERTAPGHAEIYRLYRELLALRAADPVLQHPDRLATRAGPVGRDTLAMLRTRGDADRLIVAHFGSLAEFPLDGPTFDDFGETGGLRPLWTSTLASGQPAATFDTAHQTTLRFVGPGAIVLARGG